MKTHKIQSFSTACMDREINEALAFLKAKGKKEGRSLSFLITTAIKEYYDRQRAS